MGAAPLVLLDRDGVINHDLEHSVRTIPDFRLIDGSAEAIARLNHAHVRVAVVTNQSVVGRGIISQEQLDTIHAHMRARLAEKGAHIDAIYVCTDDPSHPTDRRKPAPGMLQQALADAGANAADTPMIGDAITDMQAAFAAGCLRYLVRTGKGETTARHPALVSLQPVTITDNLAAAVSLLIEQRKT